uniref:diphosphoinositol-polyphosphate diphosphatase n=1 Tax=Papio anubis TaxID=9555 RepID=A0A8I5N3C8_PAPAN
MRVSSISVITFICPRRLCLPPYAVAVQRLAGLGLKVWRVSDLRDSQEGKLTEIPTDGVLCHVLLVSSSRHPDRWIVPGGGMEPEEEPSVAAVREVCEEAGVKGTLGRLVGIFENQERKHRTYVYVLIVTEVLEDWEDSVNIGGVSLLFAQAGVQWHDHGSPQPPPPRKEEGMV